MSAVEHLKEVARSGVMHCLAAGVNARVAGAWVLDLDGRAFVHHVPKADGVVEVVCHAGAAWEQEDPSAPGRGDLAKDKAVVELCHPQRAFPRREVLQKRLEVVRMPLRPWTAEPVQSGETSAGRRIARF